MDRVGSGAKSESLSVPTKSKAQIRRENRAKQEAQRALKMKKGEQKPKKPMKRGSVSGKKAGEAREGKWGVQPIRERTPLSLFDHLHPEVQKNKPDISELPAPVTRFAHIFNGSYADSDFHMVCISFIDMLVEVFESQRFMENVEDKFGEVLLSQINRIVSYIASIRDLTISMRNIVRYLKLTITNIEMNAGREFVLKKIVNSLEMFKRERIIESMDEMTSKCASKIFDNDVIFTYNASKVVADSIMYAVNELERKNVSVIICGSSLKQSGRRMLSELATALPDVHFSYIPFVAAPNFIESSTKVILEADAIYSNMNCLGPAGTASLAALASSKNIPVLICCSSYLFVEKAHCDSIGYNELGDLENFVEALAVGTETKEATDITNWEKIPQFHGLDLLLDLTPHEFVDVVISDVGIIPPSSAPIVMREFNNVRI